uniref:Enhancer of mRNA-decapping protein 3 n=1 Tax=Timema cristinae TaxID=61476 RepID=A0A7R9CPK9_TIMCR|nr:unnamed protein product [Timema cristinae]
MAENWLGCNVSVNCGPFHGVYQGQIINVDGKGQTITIKKVFKDGVPHTSSEVVLQAQDIVELNIIKCGGDAAEEPQSSIVAVKKPVAKRPTRSVSETLTTNKGFQLRESPRRTTDNESTGRPNGGTGNVELEEVKMHLRGGRVENHLGKTAPSSSRPRFEPRSPRPQQSSSTRQALGEGSRTPSKKDRNRQKWTERDEACFGSSINNILGHEFDFEKNLALFNKQAVYDEINASQRPDIVKHADQGRRITKYRHDENVIASAPAMYRQIIVPAPDSKEYVTDDGLVIPSITPELRNQLFIVAKTFGLTDERQTELMGRAATEIALQLLGGGHRLNPHNVHQWPTVVVLCGSHRQGAVGVNCARQLASHGVNTVVFLLSPHRLSLQIKHELSLYRLTNNKLFTTVHELPSISVDLIVSALLDSEGNGAEQPWYSSAAAWTNESRAAVLALDPPAGGTPGVDTKFSLLPILPLAHSLESGKLYLCNLACPQQVFFQVGIKYTSPFGPKFVIPLHPNDT